MYQNFGGVIWVNNGQTERQIERIFQTLLCLVSTKLVVAVLHLPALLHISGM